MLKLNLSGVPEHLLPGLAEAEKELRLTLSPDGIPTTVVRGDCLKVTLTADSGSITIGKNVELFRALAHIDREGIGCKIEEHPCFETNGLMLDASRNGVQKPDAVKFLLRRTALMGLNIMMLYTEDTYEVENYPYFGYLRGGYKKTELKDLDDYAYALGIEMVPCIQTLGHSGKILRWAPAMGKITDTADVLLVGEEETYKYIDQIIKDASEPYRSKRIHIGMDEAGSLGRGAYQRKHGTRPQMDIFSEHMQRVREITQKYGLHPMIWSDMYFAMLTPKRDYDPDFTLPEEYAKMIPDDVDLIYWDYYHHKEEFYRGVIEKHRLTGAPVMFAGGLWNWCTPVVNSDFMLSTTLPGLRASRDLGVKEVFTTAWGDCGTMSSVYSLLYGLQVYAEFDYSGEYHEELTDERFNFLNHADAKGYRMLSGFDMIPGTCIDDELPADPSFWLLFEDPMGLYFEKDLEPWPQEEHFANLRKECAHYYEVAKEIGDDHQILFWEFVDKYSAVMADKAKWRYAAPAAVRAGDREAAKELVPFAEQMLADTETMHEVWYRLWHDCCSMYGWDVIDIRMGALIARIKTTIKMMRDFAEGRIDDIPLLSEKKLSYAMQLCWFYRQYGGHPSHVGVWGIAASSQTLDW
ncbi:MAG: beta-N-acetylhexosaminidase [Clostridia bacterium]|nr:beta-N-acetylhexosaminidase [Clostridia bacterium]